jgi:WD40 repeat protein
MNHHNVDYDTTLPEALGDRYYSQDLIRDFHFKRDLVGRLLYDIAEKASILVSGGLVTQGVGDTLDITPCVGYCDFDVEVPDSFASLPPTKKTETIKVRVASTQQTNMTISSATLNGSTVNYIKLSYTETDGNSRNRAKTSGSYAYERVPSFSFVVSSVSPTDYDIVLGTIVGSPGGTFTIVQYLPDKFAPFSQINNDVALSRNHKVLVNGSHDLTLPTDAQEGDFVEIDVLDGKVKIIQSNANEIISWRRSLFTTKGTAGYLRLMPGDHAKLIYQGSGLGPQDPTKISDPATPPTGNGTEVAWSPDGRYLAVSHSTSPYVTIYDWSTGSPVKIANPATLPTGDGSGCAWSPDGRYLAVSHSTSPYVTIYDWSTGSPVKISDPATTPTGLGRGVEWSLDGRYMAVAHVTSPYVTIYDWSTGSPVKIANPGTLPAGTGSDCCWSPDGRYLAVGMGVPNYITIYDWFTGVPIKISDPGTLPANACNGCCWSSDGRYLVIGHSASPYMTIYDWSTGSPVKTSNPATLPTGNGSGCGFSPGNRFMAISHSASPYVNIYELNGRSILKISDPATLPTGSGAHASFSPDGRYLAVSFASTSPYVHIYDCRVSASKEWVLQIETMKGQVSGHQSELEYRFI